MYTKHFEKLLLRSSSKRSYLVSAAAAIGILIAIEGFRYFDETQINSLGLLPVIVMSLVSGRGPTLLCALLASIGLDLFFVEPVGVIFDSFSSIVRVVYFVGTGMLVNAMMQRIRELLVRMEKENAELTKKNERILALVAHDIRQPAANISSMCDAVLSGEMGTLPKAVEQNIEMIQQSSSKIFRLAQNLVLLASDPNKTVAMNKEKVDLQSLIGALIKRNQMFAKQKSIQLLFSGETPGAMVLGDCLRIEQVAQNLVSNAMKFSRPQSTVCVTVGKIGNATTLTVRDEGLGIPVEDVPKLFMPNQQFANRPTKGESSTGLGLTIVKSIVDAHGAQISVESKVGVGTTFTIVFPEVDSDHLNEKSNNLLVLEQHRQADKSLPEVNREIINFKELRVLVVDDDSVSRMLVLRQLGKLGVQASSAENGSEALSFMGAQNVDVILMDFEMPVMNGIEATRRIRGLGGVAKSLLIFGVTAHDSYRLFDQCIEAGMNGVITKPFTNEKLRTQLELVGVASVDKVS